MENSLMFLLLSRSLSFSLFPYPNHSSLSLKSILKITVKNHPPRTFSMSPIPPPCCHPGEPAECKEGGGGASLAGRCPFLQARSSQLFPALSWFCFFHREEWNQALESEKMVGGGVRGGQVIPYLLKQDFFCSQLFHRSGRRVVPRMRPNCLGSLPLQAEHPRGN